MQQRVDAELVTLARSGNKAAFSELIERYQPLAKRIALGMLVQDDLAQEIVQEAFLAAYLSLAQLREPERFRAWLYSIVLNTARSFLREQKRNLLSFEQISASTYSVSEIVSDTVIDPEEIAEEREMQRYLLTAVEALSQKEQAATHLFYYQQFSLQEIAAMLDISVSAVKSRLFKARKQLRAHLFPLYGEMLNATQPVKRRYMMVEMTIAAVRTNRQTGQWTVTLWNEATHRCLNLYISRQQGVLLAFALARIEQPQPTTLDFLANVLQATKVFLEEIRIETLKDDIYYASAHLRNNGKMVHEQKIRPSDALVLALRMKRPIFVAEAIMDQQGFSLPVGKTVLQLDAEQVLENHGIALPEGKTLRLDFEHGPGRDAILKEAEAMMRELPWVSPTEDELAQMKRNYIAFVLGDKME